MIEGNSGYQSFKVMHIQEIRAMDDLLISIKYNLLRGYVGFC